MNEKDAHIAIKRIFYDASASVEKIHKRIERELLIAYDKGVEHGMVKVTQETEEHIIEENRSDNPTASCVAWIEYCHEHGSEWNPVIKNHVPLESKLAILDIGGENRQMQICSQCGLVYLEAAETND